MPLLPLPAMTLPSLASSPPSPSVPMSVRSIRLDDDTVSTVAQGSRAVRAKANQIALEASPKWFRCSPARPRQLPAMTLFAPIALPPKTLPLPGAPGTRRHRRVAQRHQTRETSVPMKLP